MSHDSASQCDCLRHTREREERDFIATHETLFHNKWISLKRVRDVEKEIYGYVYSHETRCDGKIISILPYRKVYKPPGDAWSDWYYEFLMRMEATPCWGITARPQNPLKQYLSTITGGVEKDNTHNPYKYSYKDARQTAINELEEEAGYKITLDKLQSLGTCFGSKSSDSVYYLYTTNLSGVPQYEAQGDGSALEITAESIWVTANKILESKDPLASVLYLRTMAFLKEQWNA